MIKSDNVQSQGMKIIHAKECLTEAEPSDKTWDFLCVGRRIYPCQEY
jgi:hypothetical protein